MPHATHAETTPPRRSKPAPQAPDLDSLLDSFLQNSKGSKLQKAAVARLINLSGHIRTIEGEALQKALAASDPGTFLVRLAEELVPADVSPHPHYDAAIRRGIELRNRILNEDGGVVTAQEAAALLGLKTRQAIYHQIRQRMLLAVPAKSRGLCLPAWQFENGKALPGLHRVLQALSHKDPWRILLFFVSKNFMLKGQRPLDVLRSGKIDSVVRAAESHGQQGR